MANINIYGIDDIMSKLDKMQANVSKIQKDALLEAAQPVLDDAKSTVAFTDRTGDLRKSLKISNIKTSNGVKFVWVGDTERKTNYSWFVEFGHSKAPAHPFLVPAFQRNKETIKKIIANKIREAVKSE